MKRLILLSLVILGLLGVGFLVSSVSNTEAKIVVNGVHPYVTTNTKECGSVTLSFHNPTPFLFVFDYKVDGEAAVDQSPWAGLQFNSSSPLYPGSFGDRWHLVPVAGNHDQDIVKTFDAGTGVHTVEYRLAEGAEQDWYFDWQSVEVQTNCEKKVVITEQCDGTSDVAISGGDTRRTWRVNLEEKWVERYATEVWEDVATPVVEWWHENSHQWKPADSEYVTLIPASCEIPVVEQPRGTTEASTPQCSDGTILTLPLNVQVVRTGTTATIKWIPTGGNLVNIYVLNSKNELVGAEGDVPNDGEEVIESLNPTGDYNFELEQHQGCGGGQRARVGVVDSYLPMTFYSSYWVWSN